MRPTLLFALSVLLVGCAAPLGATHTGVASSSSDRPPLRSGGERLPAFSGASLAANGGVPIDDLVWALPGEGSDGSLRTDHVALRTDGSRAESLRVARLAEDHVRRLFADFGDALDMRLPSEPLRVVVHARRTAFQRALQAAAPGHPGWGAFYDPRRGAVHVCLEPAPVGALPLEADVRHEMTHQVLDLSTPMRGRDRIFTGHYLWLWEGFAAWTEGLGDVAGMDTRAPRRDRFARRRDRGEATDLPTLFGLGQDRFEGRHYDQSAVLVTFLMADGVEGSRRAVLATLRDLLRGRARRGDLERGIRMDAAALDVAWRRTG